MKLRATPGVLAVILVGVVGLALPDRVHAGFGRRGSSQSPPSSSNSNSSSRSSSSSSAPASSGFGRSSSWSSDSGHTRSARERSHRGRGGRNDGVSWRSRNRDRVYPRSWGYPVWGYGFGYVPSYPLDTPGPYYMDGQPAPVGSYSSDDPMVVGALAGDLTFGSIGPLLGVQLSLEGERLGVLATYTAAFASIAGTREFDVLHLMLGHLTYAFIASERVRVRGEVGVHIAAAPLATFVAPGAGVSAAFGLAGPLGLEARLFGNIWPYTQLDARAGLTLSLGAIGLGAGMRALYLNDNGVLGAANADDTSDTFLGPYLTFALAM